jgi:hypothetical protein
MDTCNDKTFFPIAMWVKGFFFGSNEFSEYVTQASKIRTIKGKELLFFFDLST